MDETQRAGYENFLKWLGPNRKAYETIHKLPKRGKNSVRNVLSKSPARGLQHLATAMKMVNRGQIPIPPDVQKDFTIDQKYYFKNKSRNVKKCADFIRNDRKGAESAVLLSRIINSHLQNCQKHTDNKPKTATVTKTKAPKKKATAEPVSDSCEELNRGDKAIPMSEQISLNKECQQKAAEASSREAPDHDITGTDYM